VPTSTVSKSFPVSDADLGSVISVVELLMGEPRRWRRMPWMVELFSLLVMSLSSVSVLLIMVQPVAVGAW